MKTKKSFFVAALRALFFSSPLWFSSLIIIFAFRQTFGIGLVIMLGLVAVQLILSMVVEVLKWDDFNNFSFKNDKKINIVFNLTRVGTIISALIFLFKAGVTANPFGGLGLAIAIVSAIIGLLIFLFESSSEDYELFRGCLAISIISMLVTFSYLYFETQLIWIPVFLSLVSSYSKMFWELDDEKYDSFAIFTPILLGLTGIISSTVQFSNAELFWGITLSGLMIGLLILGIIGVILFFFLISYIPYLKKKKLEQKKEIEKLEEEKRIVEQFSGIFKYGQGIHPDLKWKLEDILFIIKHRSNPEVKKRFIGSDTASLLAWGLANVNLNKVLILSVSDTKKQIVFCDKSADILKLYNESYASTYEDDVLDGLKKVIKTLYQYLNKKPLKDYKGSDDLKKIIRNECGSFPTTFLHSIQVK